MDFAAFADELEKIGSHSLDSIKARIDAEMKKPDRVFKDPKWPRFSERASGPTRVSDFMHTMYNKSPSGFQLRHVPGHVRDRASGAYEHAFRALRKAGR